MMARSKKTSKKTAAEEVIAPVQENDNLLINEPNEDEDADYESVDEEEGVNEDDYEDEDEEDEGDEDAEEEEIGDSTSDNYTSDSDIEDEDMYEEADDGSGDHSKSGKNGHRIEYESPDAIPEIEDDSDADEPKSHKKRKLDAEIDTSKGSNEGDNDADGQGDEVVQKVQRPKLFKSAKDKSQRLIVILERANLELVKTQRNNFELINCDDHMGLIRKYRKDPAFCRPDITHQCLLMLFDSPLNRAGLLQVYIHTINNILIEVIS